MERLGALRRKRKWEWEEGFSPTGNPFIGVLSVWPKWRLLRVRVGHILPPNDTRFTLQMLSRCYFDGILAPPASMFYHVYVIPFCGTQRQPDSTILLLGDCVLSFYKADILGGQKPVAFCKPKNPNKQQNLGPPSPSSCFLSITLLPP